MKCTKCNHVVDFCSSCGEPLPKKDFVLEGLFASFKESCSNIEQYLVRDLAKKNLVDFKSLSETLIEVSEYLKKFSSKMSEETDRVKLTTENFLKGNGAFYKGISSTKEEVEELVKNSNPTKLPQYRPKIDIAAQEKKRNSRSV